MLFKPAAGTGAVKIGAAALAVMASLAWPCWRFLELEGEIDRTRLLTPSAPPVADAAPDPGAIAQMGWFGAPTASPAPGAAPPRRLELKGVSRSDQAGLSGAYVAPEGGEQVFRRLGETLPEGSGTLEAVFADHIVIRRGAQTSTLAFPANAKTGETPPAASSSQ